MKLRQLAAIGLLLAFGCQAGDSSSGPASDAPAETPTETPAETPAGDGDGATSATDPEQGELVQVAFNVTGMK